MTAALRVAGLFAVMLVLMGVAPSGTVGFVDVAQALVAHPLYRVLASYDREIAALQATRRAQGLSDVAGRTAGERVALAHDTSAASELASRDALNDPSDDRATEQSALAALAQPRAGAAAARYDSELTRQAAASIDAFREATSQRVARAIAARARQLRERELTLAYDLARRNGAERLLLRLKLRELHLTPATRAKFESRLADIARHESIALASMRRADAATLATYSAQVRNAGAAAVAQMTAQLRAKAGANLAIRNGATRDAERAAAALPGVRRQAELLRTSFGSSQNASAIASGFQGSGADISRRYAGLSAADRASARGVAAEIGRLQSDRANLYRSMVAQITQIAGRLARARHLDRVVVSGTRPSGSIDLTAATRATLR